MTCEYARERKKRGKASRKEIAAQQAAAAAAAGTAGSSTEADHGSPESSRSGSDQQRVTDITSEPARAGMKRRRSSAYGAGRKPPAPRDLNRVSDTTYGVSRQTGTESVASGVSNNQNTVAIDHAAAPPQPQMIGGYPNGHALSVSNMDHHNMTDNRLPFGMGDFANIDDYHRTILQQSAAVNGQNVLHGSAAMSNPNMHLQPYQQNPYALPSPNTHANGNPMNQFRLPESPVPGNVMIGQGNNAGSPAWLDLPSPSASVYANLGQIHSQQSLRYPVLRPLLPRISSIIPISLACDLLDLYFASSSTTFIQPSSPYMLGFIMRKRSVLRKTDPRPCSRALLASMLWVAAQTSENSFLTSPPSQRGKICHQLLELTISLLRPLVHTNTSDTSGNRTAQPVINGVALGGFGVANPAASHDTEGGSTGAAASLDDVITYINLATVVSASEYKAASLRWWNAAWSLARELKLGRELPPNPPPQPQQDESEGNRHGEGDKGDQQQGRRYHPNMPQPGTVAEEEREERRRIWWLLYIVDRHLALCYNRPLFLLDVECDGLLQPENETMWQQGEYWPPENYEQSLYFRRRGPCFECTSHGIFGYFLPLMTILGEIVDMNHAKNHPRFGMRFRAGHEWDEQVNEIGQQLEAYGRSLKEFENRFIPSGDNAQDKNVLPDLGHDPNSPSVQSNSTGTNRMTEAVLQTRIVVAYGTHMMHTLSILLNGKWDPISMLDDNDLWISSQSFISATGHAVSAAEAIGDILEYDPDLSFMPFFFGIYLLQGSFLLLLIADKLQGEASFSVVKACETIVRATEVCVVTLNTEYQVS